MLRQFFVHVLHGFVLRFPARVRAKPKSGEKIEPGLFRDAALHCTEHSCLVRDFPNPCFTQRKGHVGNGCPDKHGDAHRAELRERYVSYIKPPAGILVRRLDRGRAQIWAGHGAVVLDLRSRNVLGSIERAEIEDEANLRTSTSCRLTIDSTLPAGVSGRRNSLTEPCAGLRMCFRCHDFA